MDKPLTAAPVTSPDIAPPRGRTRMRPGMCLFLLAVAATICLVLFMVVGANGHWDFVLPLRARKVVTLGLVAYAIAVSTVLFQTATGNRILTPSIMGFDALYLLIQSSLVFLLGTHQVLAVDSRLLFIVQVGIMVAASGLVYWILFSNGHGRLHQLVLAGVVLGVLFHSLSAFIQRVINPSEYAFLQDRFFASFNNPDESLLLMSAMAIAATSLWGLRWSHAYDVLGLGRDAAINLGVDHRRLVSRILIMVAVLIAVSTALVGPVTFFGLMVSHLAYALIRSHRHALLLPAAVLVGMICLLGGQLVLEQLLSFGANLRVIIDFAGGLTFIFLLIRGAAR